MTPEILGNFLMIKHQLTIQTTLFTTFISNFNGKKRVRRGGIEEFQSRDDEIFSDINYDFHGIGDPGVESVVIAIFGYRSRPHDQLDHKSGSFDQAVFQKMSFR